MVRGVIVSRFIKISLVMSLVLTLVLVGCGISKNNNQGASQEKAGNNQQSANQGDTGTNNDKSGNDKKTANKDVTITFGVTPWTSTIPPTYVAKKVLEDMGYKVKLQNGDAGVVYAGLSKGDLDVFMDSWLPDLHKQYMDKYGDKLENVAVSYSDAPTGWVVPKYMKDINSIEDLKGKEDQFKGKLYGIEEGAGMMIKSHKMVKDYGLKLDVVASSETGMLTEAKKLIDNKEPILFLGWRPHSMFAKWDLKVLEDPKGFFKPSDVDVIVHKGFDAKAPEAYKFLKNWSMPMDDIEQMILKVEKGGDPDEVAAQWITDNQDKVDKMTGK